MDTVRVQEAEIGSLKAQNADLLRLIGEQRGTTVRCAPGEGACTSLTRGVTALLQWRYSQATT
jgi:hypothetical protein